MADPERRSVERPAKGTCVPEPDKLRDDQRSMPRHPPAESEDPSGERRPPDGGYDA